MRCEFICLLKTWRPNTAQAVVCSQNDVFHILQPMGRDQLINRVVVNHAKMAVSNFERKKCFAGDFHVLCSNFNDHNTFTPDVRKSQKKKPNHITCNKCGEYWYSCYSPFIQNTLHCCMLIITCRKFDLLRGFIFTLLNNEHLNQVHLKIRRIHFTYVHWSRKGERNGDRRA